MSFPHNNNNLLFNGVNNNYYSNSQPMANPATTAGNQFEVNGDIVVRGKCISRGFYKYCDENLKTSITSLGGVLDKLVKLKPKQFHWKKENNNSNTDKVEKDIGFIAQELQQTFPEIVSENQDGYLTVNYTDLIPIVISALHELIIQAEQKEQEYKQFINEKKKYFENIKNQYNNISKNLNANPNPPNKQLVENLKKENDLHQQNLTNQNKKIRKYAYYIGFLGIMAILLTLSFLLYAFIQPTARSKIDEPMELVTQNLIKNPSFENLTPANKSLYWTEIDNANYSLIRYTNNSENFELLPPKFQLISASKPHSGLVSLVLGSTNQTNGTFTWYWLQQTVYFNNTIGIYSSLLQVNFSCFCESTNITKLQQNDTKAYIILTYIYNSTFGQPNLKQITLNSTWKNNALVLDIAEGCKYEGVRLRVVWGTLYPEVIFCDDLSLTITYIE